MRRRSAVVPLALCGLLAQLASPSPGQGAGYRERWGYLHLQRLREQVRVELAGRAAEDVDAVAELLAGGSDGSPFLPAARALAALRGVEADDAFVLRATVGVYVLPEVVDPQSTQPACTRANFSVFLPFAAPAGDALAFDLLVRDDDGDVVWRETLTEDTSVSDLRMARPRAAMPTDELPDGLYHVDVVTRIGDDGPRAHDPGLRWSFHLLRGYQARAEAAIAAARERREALEGVPRALLDGVAVQVSNAYVGQAFVVASDAVRELERLEKVLDNLEHERPVLAGLRGMVRTALPGNDAITGCTLRLDGGARGEDARPVVVFAGGAPSYDGGVRRPTAPSRLAPGWLANELGEFGVEQGWHVVCLESPGGGRPYRDDLLANLAALDQALPMRGKPLLVCDREAAAVVALHADRFAPVVSGLVLVGCGAMPLGAFDALQEVPVRLIGLAGYPGSASIDRMVALVEQRRLDGKLTPDIRLLHARRLPWLFGAAMSRAELGEFARSCFDG